MKRKSFYFLFVLFILSACQPISRGLERTGTNSSTVMITQTPTNTSTATVEPTQEKVTKSYIIKNKEPEGPDFDTYSEITLNDLLSGDLLEKEREYVKNNVIFTNEVIPQTKLSSTEHSTWSFDDRSKKEQTVKSIVIPATNEQFTKYHENPETRPIKFLSWYKLYDPNLFDEMGIDEVVAYLQEKQGPWTKEKYLEYMRTFPRLWIVTWAWANPDGSVGIGHTLFDLPEWKGSAMTAKNNSITGELMYLPGFEQTDIHYREDLEFNFTDGGRFLDMLCQKYPNLIPDKNSVNKWLETGQFPEELQNDLFSMQGYVVTW